MKQKFYIHETSIIDRNVKIGTGTKIWHWVHIESEASIGKNCTIGQNVYIGKNVKIGNNVKIQNNVSVFEGVTIGNNVFCGPSCVFTNDLFPISKRKKQKYLKTKVSDGVTIGANSTILSNITLGKNSFIGASSLVTKNVKSNFMVFGIPARHIYTISKKKINEFF